MYHLLASMPCNFWAHCVIDALSIGLFVCLVGVGAAIIMH